MVNLSRIDISGMLAPPRRGSFFSESKVSDWPDPLGQKPSLSIWKPRIIAGAGYLPPTEARKQRRDIPDQRQNRASSRMMGSGIPSSHNNKPLPNPMGSSSIHFP
jgi:hypothetical protein